MGAVVVSSTFASGLHFIAKFVFVVLLFFSRMPRYLLFAASAEDGAFNVIKEGLHLDLFSAWLLTYFLRLIS